MTWVCLGGSDITMDEERVAHLVGFLEPRSDNPGIQRKPHSADAPACQYYVLVYKSLN